MLCLKGVNNWPALKYPSIKSFSSLESMLADDSIELVVVNTPNNTHADFTRKALLAGKHVIVEKPFTITVKDADELIDLAAQKNLCLTVYQNRRYDSDYKTIRKIIAEEWLGDIIEAEFHFDRFKAALSEKLHKEIPGQGTGSLYDLGSHLIDQALQLFGMPSGVFADIRMIRPGSVVDDYFELLLYYPDKRVRVKSSYLVREAFARLYHSWKQGFFYKTQNRCAGNQSASRYGSK